MCSVIDEINLLHYRKTQQDGCYQRLLSAVTVTRYSTADLLLSIVTDYCQLQLIITTRCSMGDLVLWIVIGYCQLLLIITTRYSTADQLLSIFIDRCRCWSSSSHACSCPLRTSFFILNLNQAVISCIGVLPPVLLCYTRCSPFSPLTQ